MRPTPLHGLLVLDKPGGLTSRAALDRAQRWFPRGTKAGHTGTLDPLATGVLVLCLGAATRLTEYVQDMAKTYRAGVRLGARSDTDDADGTIAAVDVSEPPSRAAVEDALRSFLGALDQVPPAYSAAKVTGRRAYDLARQGEEVTLRPRRVHVYTIDLLRFDYPALDIEVRCGKGTYIRSLARDLGERLGCGGLIETLRRTRVGPFDVAAAASLDEGAAAARAKLQPVEAALSELPRVVLTEADVARVRRGQSLPSPGGLPGGTSSVAVYDVNGRLVAVAEAEPDRRWLRPAKVFPETSVFG